MRVQSDIASERFILAALAQNGTKTYTEISHIINDGCFFDSNNKMFWSIFQSGFKSFDRLDVTSFMTVAHNLGLTSLLEKRDNQQYLKTLFHTPIQIDNILKIAAKLKKIAITYEAQRNLEEAHKKLCSITGTESIDSILNIIEEPLGKLGHIENKESDPILLTENLPEHVDFLLQNPCSQIGISSGYPMYDYMIGGGFRKGYINLICSRPKNNKSTWALNVGLNVAKKDIPVLYLDTEMDSELQQNRLLASLVGIDYNKIETGLFGDAAEYVKRKAESIKNTPFYYKRIAGQAFDVILSTIKRWVYRHKKENCLVIYDYFKLMDSGDLGNMQEYQALGFQLSKFTDYLGNSGVSCLAFVQTNREGITKETTDILSQSDRLAWLCASLALLRKKTTEEIVQEGPQRGTHKLIPMDAMRFSKGLDSKDWINLNVDNFKITELGTHKKPNNGGFQLEDDRDSRENSEQG